MSLRSEILSRVFIGIGATAESIGQLLAGDGADPGQDGRTEPGEEPADAPSVQGRTFAFKFAQEVSEGELLAIDGRSISRNAGRRALRVTR